MVPFRRRHEEGTALVIALIVAVVGTITMGAAGVLAMEARRAADSWRTRGAAVYVAESGINEALFRLKHDVQLVHREYPAEPPSFRSPAGAVGPDGGYEVWVWPDPQQPHIVRVVSLGWQGRSRQLVRTATRPLQANPWAPENAASPPTSPPPGVPTLPVLPEPTLPPGEQWGDLILSGNVTYTMGNADGTPREYFYNRIIISGVVRIVLLGPVNIWLRQSMALSGSCQLNVKREGSTWVRGDPRDLRIWVPGDRPIGLNVSGTAQIHGCIYAPHSVLNISGTADLYGALAVRWVNISGAAGIHEVYFYDSSMGNTPWPAGVPLDWRVVSYE